MTQVITWQRIPGYPGPYPDRLDLCKRHSDALDGPWQVHFGKHTARGVRGCYACDGVVSMPRGRFFEVGDRVAGGEIPEDYDVGVIVALDLGDDIVALDLGDDVPAEHRHYDPVRVEVAWEWSQTRTTQLASMLHHEDPDETERMRAALDASEEVARG